MNDTARTAAREPLQASFSDAANPLGLDGIEFIEYATGKPQALGQVLETMGFKPVARHRSREVLLYRQGGLNVVVNAHPQDATGATHGSDVPSIAAIALRVREARAAYQYVLERGAWAVSTHPEVMELNIPAIHGAGGSRMFSVRGPMMVSRGWDAATMKCSTGVTFWPLVEPMLLIAWVAGSVICVLRHLWRLFQLAW